MSGTPEIRDDTSLQGWGRRLAVMSSFLEELKTPSVAAGEMREAAALTRRFAVHGTDNLPANPRLAAEVETVANGMDSLAAEYEALEERRKMLASQAETLHTQYRSSHEMDEARLNGERAPLQRERLADVQQASQDT
jgi:hypothetical protein